MLIFPCDQFGGQELPEAKVPDFCESKGVPTNAPGSRLMAKVDVNGPNSSPAWSFVKKTFPGDVKWNFDAIFLVNKEGTCVSRHSIRKPPTAADISKLLA